MVGPGSISDIVSSRPPNIFCIVAMLLVLSASLAEAGCWGSAAALIVATVHVFTGRIRTILTAWWDKPRSKKPPWKGHRKCSKFYGRARRIGIKGAPALLTMATACVLQTGHADYPAVFDSDAVPVYIDNCASVTVTNSMDDVIGTPVPIRRKIDGFGGGAVACQYRVSVCWPILDDAGNRHDMIIKDAMYSKQAPTRLFSPQQWARQSVDHRPEADGTRCTTFDNRILLEWEQRKYKKTVPLDGKTNVGIMTTAPSIRRYKAFRMETQRQPQLLLPPGYSARPAVPHEQLAADANKKEPSTNAITRNNVIINEEDAIAGPQQLLMSLHHRLSHTPFAKLQAMAKRGELPAALKDCPVPTCSACAFGKQTKRQWRYKTPKNKVRTLVARKPGDIIAMDVMDSSVPGFVGQVSGKLTTKRYTGAVVFVDTYSSLSYTHLLVRKTAEDLIAARKAYLVFCRRYCVTPKHFHADNGIFAARAFREDVERTGHTLSFCGVNAHHQNGHAEKRIRDLQDQARTAMLHAQSRWPSMITTHLWPYAIRDAEEAHRLTPNLRFGKTPLEIFSGVYHPPDLTNTHTFGCPVYVLDDKIQRTGRATKWQERARVGVYLGHSPQHASSIGLILNATTGHVSAQFHCTYDDRFQTVRAGVEKVRNRWAALAGFTTASYDSEPFGSKPKAPPMGASSVHVPRTLPAMPEETATQNEGAEAPTLEEEGAFPAGDHDEETVVHENVEQPPEPTRRSRRNRQPTRRALESVEQESLSFVAFEAIAIEPSDAGKYDEGITDPVAFAASANVDTMYVDQALRAHDSDKFKEAMLEEFDSHTNNGHWMLVPKTAIQTWNKLVPAVWSMKRKRRIDTREVYKWKARLNMHGGKTVKGIHYEETTSPVIKWFTLRLALTLTTIHGWYSRQVDFVLAYPQADMEADVFMEIPQGFRRGGLHRTHCLKLLKNLYGGKNSGRLWYLHLRKGLEKLGFEASKLDECLFYRGDTMLLVYVDDCIIVSKTKESVHQVMEDLRDAKFDITDEGDICDYLGVKVEKLSDGRIKLSQPHLIDQIIADLGLKDDSKGLPAPALSTRLLHRHLDEEPHKEKWEYRSVIGLLNFLEKSTRPDIAFAVHQCARFCVDPRESHSKAVKRIGRYLLQTRDEGIILNPGNLSFECHVDADFAGNWRREDAEHDPTTARSRTGYVITYASCALFWHSKLQGEIALSTTEAEYIALSEAMREVIPAMDLVTEMRRRGFGENVGKPIVKCTAFEDNEGAIALAKTPKLRPRTKHINIKYHHFREHVEKGHIEVVHVSTEEQLADLLTKPLSEAQFAYLRDRILRIGRNLVSEEECDNMEDGGANTGRAGSDAKTDAQIRLPQNPKGVPEANNATRRRWPQGTSPSVATHGGLGY